MRNGPRGSYRDGDNSYNKEMDAALAADPPSITWEKRNGVMVAVFISDPHTKKRTHRPRRRNRPDDRTEVTYKGETP